MCFRKKYKSLKEIEIDVFDSHYKKREKNSARLIKYFSKYPQMFEQFDQEELKTLKAYCYIFYQEGYVYRCQKIKEYLFPQIKQYVNGERELGSLEELSSAEVIRELNWLVGYIYSENYPEEYGFINCLISFSELNTWRGRSSSEEQMKEAGEFFNKAKGFADKETLDVFQKMFDIFSKKNSSTRTGTIIFDYGEYNGEIVWDKPNGKGKLTFDNGDVYKGKFKDGKFHGKGVFYYANGEKCECTFKNGLRNGEGIYYGKKGNETHGTYVDDKLQGKIIQYVIDKKTKEKTHAFIGQAVDDLFEGVFELYDLRKKPETLIEYRIYEHDKLRFKEPFEFMRKKLMHSHISIMQYYKYFEEGKPDFPWNGKYVDMGDGYYYAGGWSNKKMHGKGHIKTPTGEIVGKFVNGQLVEGSKYDSKGELIYVGEFLGASYHGKGTQFLNDGYYVSGTFVNDEIDDTKKIFCRLPTNDNPGADVFEGEMIGHVKQGKGVYYNGQTGEYIEGFYVDNEVKGEYIYGDGLGNRYKR